MARTPGKTDIPDKLLAAGRELFSQQGYNATGIQQITDLAGVPKGSFYNNIDSKEAFAAAHIPGSVNIPLGHNLPTWAGWVLPYDRPTLIVPDDPAVDQVTLPPQGDVPFHAPSISLPSSAADAASFAP